MLRLLLIISMSAAPALANPKTILSQYAKQAHVFARHAHSSELTDEIGTLRSWISEAKAFEKKPKSTRFKRALARVEAQAKLIEALLLTVRAKAEAELIRATATQAEQDATAAYKRMQEAKQFFNALEVEESKTP